MGRKKLSENKTQIVSTLLEEDDIDYLMELGRGNKSLALRTCVRRMRQQDQISILKKPVEFSTPDA